VILPEWADAGACVDMPSSMFFPIRQGPADRRAKAVCAGCAVKVQCLEYALDYPAHYDYGIFGGTNAKERRVLRRGRAA
jgi:WhiB family redox-sensing transcriptional regulator